MLTVQFKHSEFAVDPEARIVSTAFPDGKVAIGFRADSDENRREAEDEGYQGPNAIWEALLHHEAAHSLLSAWMWDLPSPTLRHEAGGERCIYGQRLFEEAVVIAFQRYVTTGEVWPALEPMRVCLLTWKIKFRVALAGLMREVDHGL